MDQLEQLQQLWQGQTARSIPAADVERLTRSMKAYGRRQYAINIGKALLVAAVLAWSIGKTDISVQVIAGWGLIAVAAAIAAVGLFALQSHGVELVGAIPRDCPRS